MQDVLCIDSCKQKESFTYYSSRAHVTTTTITVCCRDLPGILQRKIMYIILLDTFMSSC